MEKLFLGTSQAGSHRTELLVGQPGFPVPPGLGEGWQRGLCPWGSVVCGTDHPFGCVSSERKINSASLAWLEGFALLSSRGSFYP